VQFNRLFPGKKKEKRLAKRSEKGEFLRLSHINLYFEEVELERRNFVSARSRFSRSQRDRGTYEGTILLRSLRIPFSLVCWKAKGSQRERRARENRGAKSEEDEEEEKRSVNEPADHTAGPWLYLTSHTSLRFPRITSR